MQFMKFLRGTVLLLSVASILGAGCSVRESEADSAKPPTPNVEAGKSPDTTDGPVTPTSGDKIIGGDTGPGPDLAVLEADMAKAKAAFEKASGNEAAKKAYVDAKVKLATETMLDPNLPPREKYPKALKLYREVLEMDPKNEEAKVNSQQIVDIYKSMGRPVPK